MSSNTNDPWKTNGQNTLGGSINQGIHEAQHNHYASTQQPGEHWINYEARIGAFNDAKKSQNG